MKDVVAVACAAALAVAAIRWLRVAQREHYRPGSASLFGVRWWTRTGVANLVLLLVASVGFVAVWWIAVCGLLCAIVELVGPIGLSVRGRTSKLAWTRRLRTTAGVIAVFDGGVIVVGAVLGRPLAVLADLCTLQPVVIDLALAVCSPFERMNMRRYVRTATATLRTVDPLVVALTGSFGKTTTKLYAAHLISSSRRVLASPASFNNTGGLARTINEHLRPGTEVFIAEMGTYGRGEIADLCSWLRPSVASIVNIGPVHLERMKSLDNIVSAKAEITGRAQTVVLNVDAYGLSDLADRLVLNGKIVIRCSGIDRSADVTVLDGVVWVRGEQVGPVDALLPSGNVACAIGLALAVGIEPGRIAGELASLPVAPHRREIGKATSGVTVLDNTFSSNPAGAGLSLGVLQRLAQPGRRTVVVTPGMVELGREQRAENNAFGLMVGDTATDLVVVGRTNRAALVEGARGGVAAIHHVRTREQAVTWVRATLGPGDVVLYENDLPDHYP
jgi:UDP-N-acetylmuramoyl-tripeptide--D-alanyl-D-alanine ligase